MKLKSLDTLFNESWATLSTEEQLKHEIATEVARARISRGLSQEELAEKSGTHQSSIARLESGSSLPSLRFLSKIAASLDTQLISPRFDTTPTYQVSSVRNASDYKSEISLSDLGIRSRISGISSKNWMSHSDLIGDHYV